MWNPEWLTKGNIDNGRVQLGIVMAFTSTSLSLRLMALRGVQKIDTLLVLHALSLCLIDERTKWGVRETLAQPWRWSGLILMSKLQQENCRRVRAVLRGVQTADQDLRGGYWIIDWLATSQASPTYPFDTLVVVLAMYCDFLRNHYCFPWSVSIFV